MDVDCALQAEFAPRTDDAGPVACSLGRIDANDSWEYYCRVLTNNTLETTLVDRVIGIAPDPNGMVRMQEIDGSPARVKARFGRSCRGSVLVQFRYLFEDAAPTEIVVSLSDVPGLWDHDNRWSAGHHLEIGRVAVPPQGEPGSFGSNCFGVFEQQVVVQGLDLSGGTWVELEFMSVRARADTSPSGGEEVEPVSDEASPSVLFDALTVEGH